MILLLLFLLQPSPGKAQGLLDNKALFSLWAEAKEPLAGEAASIGSYSAGCLAGAAKLDLDGEGYSVMRPSRRRYFGHPALVHFLQGLGVRAEEAGLARLLIGDMGRPRGGPMLSGHASHQIGLDVDIWYDTSRKRPTLRQREKWGATSYVTRKGKVKRGWGDKQRKLVELAAEAPEVERIFVHAALKRDLCHHFPDAPWLAKLRPWWGHDDHLHVRLRCQPGSSQCENQQPVAELGPQCGKEIDWWFSKEAQEELAKRTGGGEREFPKLPAACDAVWSQRLATKGEK
jgi:penicillin-insensitive murein endopeptidase